MDATPATTNTPLVVICGSINVDTCVRVTQFPQPGETVLGADSMASLGGKGANQAVAAAHFGVDAQLVSAVGADAHGEFALEQLRAHGVDTRHVRTLDAPTGQAFILSDAAGENMIVVSSGANALLSPAEAAERYTADTGVGPRGTHPGSILLAQGELAPHHSAELPELAEHLGARVVLNLAPVTTRDPRLIAAADPLILNEGEAADLLGLPPDRPQAEVLSALQARLTAGGFARSAVVTLGPRGAVVLQGDGATTIPAPPAPSVVDTTGAGDAFCGTLAAALAQGADLVTAARYGAAAGSLAVGARGAACSYAPGEAVRDLARRTSAQA